MQTVSKYGMWKTGKGETRRLHVVRRKVPKKRSNKGERDGEVQYRVKRRSLMEGEKARRSSKKEGRVGELRIL